jgi:hypothetical protein
MQLAQDRIPIRLLLVILTLIINLILLSPILVQTMLVYSLAMEMEVLHHKRHIRFLLDPVHNRSFVGISTKTIS